MVLMEVDRAILCYYYYYYYFPDHSKNYHISTGLNKIQKGLTHKNKHAVEQMQMIPIMYTLAALLVEGKPFSVLFSLGKRFSEIFS